MNIVSDDVFQSQLLLKHKVADIIQSVGFGIGVYDNHPLIKKAGNTDFKSRSKICIIFYTALSIAD
jgi:hypothetical protein